MSFLPNRPATVAAPTSQVNWPLADELFDYEQFLAAGPIAAPPPQGGKVGIVGAGAAGMVAAYELLRAGYMPVVFEASDRIGGRNWSLEFTENGQPTGVIAEMGAMRVPPSNKVFYRYFDQFGLTPGVFPDPGKVLTALYYENEGYLWEPTAAAAPGPFARLATEFNEFMGLLLEDLNAGYASANLGEVQSAWQRLIDKYRNMSFYEALVDGIPSWGAEDLNAFGSLGMGSGGFGPLYGVCFLEMLRLLANQFETDQQLVVQGIGAITEGLATAEVTLPNSSKVSLASLGAIQLNTAVTGISNDGGNPRLEWEGGGETFGAVIVATTTRAMEFMGLTTPPATDTTNSVISSQAKVGIRNLHLMESSKLFIRTATKFWLDGNGQPIPGMPQNIQTDELPRGVYCLDYPHTDNGVVLISYTWGDDSAKLLSLSPAERFAIFRDILATIAPGFAAQLVPIGDDGGIVNVDWEAESGYNGAFKLDSPGQEPDVQAVYYQFQSALGEGDTGVYLAGDSVSWHGGWTEGALHTGINAACAAAHRLGGTVASGSPLTMDANAYSYGQVLPAPVP